jgi:3-oxoacyl-[acyl-carrier protein] reductase
MSGRRVALVANTGGYIGPALARELARRGHDLVIGDPEDGLVEELRAGGAHVEAVTDVVDLRDPVSSQRLVSAATDAFGRLDAAVAFSGRIVIGPFLSSTPKDLSVAIAGCLEAPYHFLRAVVPVMVEQRGGQVLVVTSSSGARVTPNAPLYSAVRAGANHLVKNVAAEVARHGVQVNALGTNNMDFPAFLEASGATDPEVRARLESRVPMRRLGTVEECAALAAAYLDGTCGFVTGQFVAHDGGWS